ncbi:hypothetical protein C7974DRAFT_415584 [Boeremia exigua]|uniref:uncharacterized protein n=1 Tax=Boeremia exigua TaxID=749465 RepID=UPI001E8DC9EF|nr:uncharacterized protein C7974DRAFT_415584 [Boeremia exigua]KAH6620374.1 hypothetical protein C7974DRAFT_415584 [Boeremia exigua]
MPFATSVLHSRQFTFLIGVDQTPIIVHSGAIAALSEPLDRLLNGPFQEAQSNQACFEYIEVEDFEKICAVAYGAALPVPEIRTLPPNAVNIREDYWVLSPRIVGPDSLTARNNKLTAHVLCATLGDLNNLPGIPDRKDSQALYENTVDDFHRCGLLNIDDDETQRLPAVGGTAGGTVPPRNPTWNQDVSSALLGYARIYLFSDEHLITQLQKDAEAGLRGFLARLDIYPPTRAAIVELIQYVYDGEIVPDRADGEAMHPLREMVVKFMALHLSAFGGFAPHTELVRRGGDYAVDLHEVTVEWLL